MTAKEITRDVLEKLPDDATLRDVMYALYVREQFEQGLHEFDESGGIPHEEVFKRLKR